MFLAWTVAEPMFQPVRWAVPESTQLSSRWWSAGSGIIRHVFIAPPWHFVVAGDSHERQRGAVS
jgi:hypothetical protein